jgi:hypothetical protein
MSHFLQDREGFHFARWNRPLELAVHSTSPAAPGTLERAFGAALDRVCAWSGLSWQKHDGTRAPNLVLLFVNRWAELATLSMDIFGPLAIPRLIDRMTTTGATQFRTFSYATDGSIASAFGFYNMSSRIRDYPAERIALAQTLLTHANFSLGALQAPVVEFDGATWNPSRDVRLILQAAYAADMPASLHDEAGADHLYRSYSRLIQTHEPETGAPADRAGL